MFFFKLHAKQFLLSTALIPSLALTTTVKVHAASNTEDAFDNAANTFFWDIMDSSPINLHYSFSFQRIINRLIIHHLAPLVKLSPRLLKY